MELRRDLQVDLQIYHIGNESHETAEEQTAEGQSEDPQEVQEGEDQTAAEGTEENMKLKINKNVLQKRNNFFH